MRSAKRKGFEDVRSSPNPAVNGDGDLPSCGRGADAQRVQGGWHAIQLPAAVIGYEDAVEAMVDR